MSRTIRALDGEAFKGPDPKPTKRKRKQIRKVHRRVTQDVVNRDRMCLICGKHAESGHHVLGKGSPYFGDDLEENIVALCGDGVRGCHGLIENEDIAARKILGIKLVTERADVIYYVRMKLGEEAGADWLRRRLFII